MKTSISSSRRGIALVIVLSLLVLITVLVVGFLGRVGGERAATANYYAAATTRQLADTAVNLVQAQINEATTGGSGTMAWASQPGAVRVFDNKGQLTKIYRLYSAPALVTIGDDASVLKTDVPPAEWSSYPALWVDLNAPVTISSGSAGTSGTGDYCVFPILDPRDPANPGDVATPTVTGTMDGFSIETTVPGATKAQPVPMPVQWLYVLQNGKMVSPTASGSNSVTISGASSSNPVVGRIAFWTDDECAKVNINTAAGSMSNRPDPSTGNKETAILPSPWDTPRFRISDERRLFSQCQPVKGEFQRYPGHPATTDLYGIFSALGLPMYDSYPFNPGNDFLSTRPYVTSNTTQSGMMIYTPRYGDAISSQAGTADSTATANYTTGTDTFMVMLQGSRLYTSLGEMYFSSGSNSRVATGVTRQQLESGKFFLTAHSRAPEATLFGTPRISMWPIDSDYGSNPVVSNTTASTFDKLISFCTTTGTGSSRHPYYIQRHDSTSTTSDYKDIQRNQDLYSYLQWMTHTAIPGFGGTFSNKYGDAERDQILTEMVDYVRCTNLYDHSTTDKITRFTPPNVTGTAGVAQAVPLHITTNSGLTSGLGRMHTISEMGVLVICTAEGSSVSHTNIMTKASSTAYQLPTKVDGAWVSPAIGSASDFRYVSNLPTSQYLRDSDGKIVGMNSSDNTYVKGGTSSLPTGSVSPFPSNKTLVSTYSSADPDSTGTSTALALQPGQKRLQAILLFEPSSPMHGMDPMIKPDFNIAITDLSNLVIQGASPFASCDGTTTTPTTRTGLSEDYGGVNGFQYFMSQTYINTRESRWSTSVKNANNIYRFVSDPFTVPAGNINIQTSNPFTVMTQVRKKTGGGVETAQTFKVAFPTVSVGSPDLMMNALMTGTATANDNTVADWWGFDFRVKKCANTYNNNNYQSLGCVIRAGMGTSPETSGTDWSLMSQTKVPILPYCDASGNYATSSSLPASDVVRTLVPRDEDYRITMAKPVVVADGATDMVTLPKYSDGSYKLVHTFMEVEAANRLPGANLSGKLVQGASYSTGYIPKAVLTTGTATMDWDNGLPCAPDGAYANKPDEGNIYVNGQAPYYNAEAQGDMTDFVSYFTANRIIPSAVMFGSLPTGVKTDVPWRTLIFRPRATVSDGGATYKHDSLGTPPDHLLLDLFSMPVVEPYAISEPFSTAGKVNMNYQIVPFTYINRSTSVRAVLGSELIARIPLGSEQSYSGSKPYYKPAHDVPGLVAPITPPKAKNVSMARLPLNLDETDGTLAQFEQKFANWEIFKSPSEICDIYLVPKTYTWPGFDTKWYGDEFALVGDNVRERPYADIYPRLTTKSNTYTVHFRVQAIKIPGTAQQDVWNESTGAITGEYRGSTTVERYLDPNNASIPDYATNSSAASLDTFYQWRTVSNTAFAP